MISQGTVSQKEEIHPCDCFSFHAFKITTTTKKTGVLANYFLTFLCVVQNCQRTFNCWSHITFHIFILFWPNLSSPGTILWLHQLKWSFSSALASAPTFTLFETVLSQSGFLFCLHCLISHFSLAAIFLLPLSSKCSSYSQRGWLLRLLAVPHPLSPPLCST